MTEGGPSRSAQRNRPLSAILAICRAVDGINGTIGRCAAWLVLFMALAQFALVLLRYVFGTGSLFMQEAIVYAHGLLFMLAAAWTMMDDRHVRVDVFYGHASPRRQAMVNLFGIVFFVWPMCWLIWTVGFPYVARSWAVLEGSRETSGIPGIFLLKTVILVFAVSVALEGLSLAVRAARTIAGGRA